MPVAVTNAREAKRRKCDIQVRGARDARAERAPLYVRHARPAARAQRQRGKTTIIVRQAEKRCASREGMPEARAARY